MQCLGQLDDKKMTMAIDKGFGFFDKDKSGFVEGAEAAEAAQKVLNMIGGPAKVRAAAEMTGAWLSVIEGYFGPLLVCCLARSLVLKHKASAGGVLCHAVVCNMLDAPAAVCTRWQG